MDENPFDSWDWFDLLDHMQMFRERPRMRSTEQGQREYVQSVEAYHRKLSAKRAEHGLPPLPVQT